MKHRSDKLTTFPLSAVTGECRNEAKKDDPERDRIERLEREVNAWRLCFVTCEFSNVDNSIFCGTPPASKLVYCVLCQDVDHEGSVSSGVVHIFSTPEKRQAFVEADDQNRFYVNYDYVIDCPERTEHRPQ